VDAVNEHGRSVSNPRLARRLACSLAHVSKNPDAREGKQLENVETVKIARSFY
jgi:hypothetical protein